MDKQTGIPLPHAHDYERWGQIFAAIFFVAAA
jgi:hypothetical protein